MTLVRLVDAHGPVWVSPRHVAYLRAEDGGTRIWLAIPFVREGDYYTTEAPPLHGLWVQQNPEIVARLLDEALASGDGPR